MSEEPFECKVCHKSFHHLLNLLGHSRLHSDSFRKGSIQLRNPKRLVLNTAQISIYCSFCGKGFSGKTELLNHIKTHHPNEEIFQCDLCNKSFSQKLISSHMEAHENEKSFSCDKNQNAETKKNSQITGPKQENEVMSATRQCVGRLVDDVVELQSKNANECKHERSQSLAHKSTQKKGSIKAKQNQVARAAQSKKRKLKPLISQFTIEIATSAVAESDIFPGYSNPGNHKFITLSINEDKVKTVSQHVHKQAKSAEKRPENS